MLQIMGEIKAKKRINCERRQNPGFAYSVERKSFMPMEINIPRDSDFMKRAWKEAGRILPKLNRGQANSSEIRDLTTVELDNLSGIIAEMACKEILDWEYGKEKVERQESETSYNQVDLRLYNGKTIEVRSSCVRNGIDFALFAKKDQESKGQYFDVIGPYSNGYKGGESYKDYYMRVLYVCDKHDFMKLLGQPFLNLWITGGATKAMMMNPDIVQEKHLTPAGGQVKVESDYHVIPLSKSLDIAEFFQILEAENKEMHRRPR